MAHPTIQRLSLPKTALLLGIAPSSAWRRAKNGDLGPLTHGLRSKGTKGAGVVLASIAELERRTGQTFTIEQIEKAAAAPAVKSTFKAKTKLVRVVPSRELIEREIARREPAPVPAPEPVASAGEIGAIEDDGLGEIVTPPKAALAPAAPDPKLVKQHSDFNLPMEPKASLYQPRMPQDFQAAPGTMTELGEFAAALGMGKELGEGLIGHLAEIGPAFARMSDDAKLAWTVKEQTTGVRLAGGDKQYGALKETALKVHRLRTARRSCVDGEHGTARLMNAPRIREGSEGEHTGVPRSI
jgi:hypothetical protein